MYVPFILFEGVSKSVLFYRVLNFAILSVFNVRNVIIWHRMGGGGSDQFTVSEKTGLPLPPPPQYSEPCPPPPPPPPLQYSKPSYTYDID